MSGVFESDLVPLENIDTVPITYFVGTKEDFCPLEDQQESLAKINSKTKKIDVEGADHRWFSDYGNSPLFVEQLLEELVVP